MTTWPAAHQKLPPHSEATGFTSQEANGEPTLSLIQFNSLCVSRTVSISILDQARLSHTNFSTDKGYTNDKLELYSILNKVIRILQCIYSLDKFDLCLVLKEQSRLFEFCIKLITVCFFHSTNVQILVWSCCFVLNQFLRKPKNSEQDLSQETHLRTTSTLLFWS